MVERVIEQETGPFRRYWNYFKRGKNEINFLLNIYQTIVIIWGATNKGNVKALYVFTIIFGLLLAIASILIGEYAIKKLDPTLPLLNPFSQDVIRYRSLMARGHRYLADGQGGLAGRVFDDAERVLIRWLNDG